jgi:LCP family protein required for cell wall assembly
MIKKKIDKKSFSISQIKILIIQFIIICIFGIILVISIVCINQSNAQLINKMQESSEYFDIINQSLLLLSHDSNTMRDQLGMSKKDYPILRNRKEIEEEEDPVLLLFRAVEIVKKRNQEEKLMIKFHKFKTSPEFLNVLKIYFLESIEEEAYTLGLYKGKNRYFTLFYSPENEQIRLTAAGTTEINNGSWGRNAFNFIERSLPTIVVHFSQVLQLSRRLATIKANDKIAALLKQKDLTLSPLFEDRERFYITVSKEKRTLITASIKKSDKSYSFNNKPVVSFDALLHEFISTLENIDTRTVREIGLEQAQNELEAVFKDLNFIRLSESVDIKINLITHENDYFIYYDILHNSEKIGCFALDKYNYKVYITDKDEVQLGAVNSLLDLNISKKADITTMTTNIHKNDDSITFLACGVNQNLSDTIILIHADIKRERITLISIPRDLIYKGIKVNYLNKVGMDRMVQELSEITGLKIEKYVTIDMFALVEVIDILGGIDITLEYDLIDPTYKIKEDGIWQTLYYKKGRYHFNGIQTLRVARSRYTSMDFDRARRQQIIIESIIKKCKSLSIINLDKIYELIHAAIIYVKTNISPLEISSYFYSFKDFKINSRNVLDTSNVLCVSYSNVYLLPKEEQEELEKEEKEFDKGDYMLLPKDNDWDLIKLYIQELISK